MKKIKLIPFLAILFILNVASMCNKDDDNPTDSNLTQVSNTVSSGTWKITLYSESGTIKTSNFSGYNFSFGGSNLLTVSNGTNSYSGVWSISDSNSNDDTLDDLHFNIAFTTPVNFSDLSNDWHIVSRTDTKIVLNDISGGNGGADYLTFEKN